MGYLRGYLGPFEAPAGILGCLSGASEGSHGFSIIIHVFRVGAGLAPCPLKRWFDNDFKHIFVLITK